MKHDTDDVNTQRETGDRRHLSLAQVAVVVAMLAQLAALVWGAATINASVDGLTKSMILVTRQIETTQTAVNALSVTVGILKDRADKK